MCEAQLIQIKPQEGAGPTSKDDAASVIPASLTGKNQLTKTERVDSVGADTVTTDSSLSPLANTQVIKVPGWFRMVHDF